MLVTQLGISMMVPIFLCVLVGGFIDKKAGTGWGMPVFLFLGMAAAFRNVYLLLKPFYAKDKEREDLISLYLPPTSTGVGGRTPIPASIGIV